MSNQQDPSLHPLRQPATPEQERRVREILEGQGITLEHWLCEPGAVLTVGDALAVIDHAEAGEEIAQVEGAPTVIDIDRRDAIANETLAHAGLDAALLRLNRAMADFSEALRDVIESGAATRKSEG